jgi:hypothetical protein
VLTGPGLRIGRRAHLPLFLPNNHEPTGALKPHFLGAVLKKLTVPGTQTVRPGSNRVVGGCWSPICRPSRDKTCRFACPSRNRSCSGEAVVVSLPRMVGRLHIKQPVQQAHDGRSTRKCQREPGNCLRDVIGVDNMMWGLGLSARLVHLRRLRSQAVPSTFIFGVGLTAGIRQGQTLLGRTAALNPELPIDISSCI